MFEYKGHHGGRIELGEDGFFHGRVLGLRDVITFAGKSPEELEQAFRDSLETYLAYCAQEGEAPDKPHSGKFQVRIDPGLHRKVVAASEAQNMSMNAWVARALKKVSDRELG